MTDASKNNVIDMGKYSYRIKILKMYRDPLYFAQQMPGETKLNVFQKAYLHGIIKIKEEEGE